MLGTPGEENKYKIYYFTFMIFVFLYLAWAYIGSTNKLLVNFYMWFGLLALIFIIFDNLTAKRFGFIDTITVEKSWIDQRVVLALAIIFALVLGSKIQAEQKAFINYPQFQIFDERLPNAILSGFAGIVEDWVFWGFLTPTLASIIMFFSRNEVLAILMSILLVSGMFMIYHIFVYGSNQQALISAFIFGLIGTTTTILFRSLIIINALHFVNNFTASLLMLGAQFIILM